MSESVEHLHDMGLPAAVLHALVPRSHALAEAQKPPSKPHDVDRFTSGDEASAPAPEPVVTELRRAAELHQAQQAARAADES